MIIDWTKISAIATVVYGGGTLLLVIQIWRDRVQRDKHFRETEDNRKLNDLRTAFYDAVGNWEGHKPENRSGDSLLDAAHASRVWESLTRLECQLRLNGYKKEANDLGFATRTLEEVEKQLDQIGVALELFNPQYSKPSAVGFKQST